MADGNAGGEMDAIVQILFPLDEAEAPYLRHFPVCAVGQDKYPPGHYRFYLFGDARHQSGQTFAGQDRHRQCIGIGETQFRLVFLAQQIPFVQHQQ
jgi:hypothetical protein